MKPQHTPRIPHTAASPVAPPGRRLFRGLVVGATALTLAFGGLAIGAGQASSMSHSSHGSASLGKSVSGARTKPSQVNLSKVKVPKSWKKTVGATSPKKKAKVDFYMVDNMFHSSMDMPMGGTLTPKDLRDSMLEADFLDFPIKGKMYTKLSCKGKAVVNTSKALSCTLKPKSKKHKPLYVSIRALPTPYGHMGTMSHVTSKKSAAPFKLPKSSSIAAEERLVPSVKKMTNKKAAEGLKYALRTMHDHQWNGEPDPRTKCQLRNKGKNAVCWAEGTPGKKKADGVYYGTAYPSWDGKVSYLFTRLP